MIAFSGAISDGFNTIVQPAANAGATFAAIWLTGQFQGVMNAHTPTGSRTTVVVPIFSSNSNSRSASTAVVRCTRPDGA